MRRNLRCGCPRRHRRGNRSDRWDSRGRQDGSLPGEGKLGRLGEVDDRAVNRNAPAEAVAGNWNAKKAERADSINDIGFISILIDYFRDAYHCDAVAEVPTRVVVIPKLELRSLLAQQQRLSDQLMARLVHQIQDLRSRLELRNIRSARERVWQVLLLAAGENARTVTFDRPLKVIAGEAGLTHEAFYRALSKLSQAGRIRRRGSRIVLKA